MLGWILSFYQTMCRRWFSWLTFSHQKRLLSVSMYFLKLEDLLGRIFLSWSYDNTMQRKKKSVVQLIYTSWSFIGQKETLSRRHHSLQNHWWLLTFLQGCFVKSFCKFNFIAFWLTWSPLKVIKGSIYHVSGPSVATAVLLKTGSAIIWKGILLI